MRREEMQAEYNIRMLEYANKRGITLDQAKTELAKTAMTLQAQRELAAAEHGVEFAHAPQQGRGRGRQAAPPQPRHQGGRQAARPAARPRRQRRSFHPGQ
jgi:hypothetical protein